MAQATGALRSQHGGAAAAEGFEHDVAGIRIRVDHELRQGDREHGRVVDVAADLALVPHHTDHRIRDPGVLGKFALVCPTPANAVLAPHRGRRAVGAQVLVLASVLARHGLVCLASLTIEVEDEFEGWCQPATPVAGHARSLVPHVPAEPPPALRAHPRDPGIPVWDDLAVAVDQPEVDEHLAVARHRHVAEDAAHQHVPVRDTTGGVIALVGVGRRGKAQRGLLARHQGRDHRAVGGIAADQAVLAQEPDVARPGHRHRRCCGHVVRLIRFRIARPIVLSFAQLVSQQRVDLGVIETGQGQVVAGVSEFREFQRQQFLVPARIERDTVVGEDQRALLRRRQVGQLDHRHLVHAELARGGQTPMARDHTVLAIDQDRVGPAVLHDAGGDPGHLLVVVGPRVPCVRNQRRDLAVLDVEHVLFRVPKRRRPARERISAQAERK
ncbi:hypothetical protein GO300_05143 [Ralstonia solanacearum]|nr:hypothetical protein [Ralstonia solanacearum]